MPSRTIRPRPGDLERAASPHEPVPSGEYVGAGMELCDLCGLSFGSPMHDPDRVARVAGQRATTEGARPQGVYVDALAHVHRRLCVAFELLDGLDAPTGMPGEPGRDHTGRNRDQQRIHQALAALNGALVLIETNDEEDGDG